MKILVGQTGFVGSNLWKSNAFDLGFHSKNIEEAYGLKPDLLVYAGLRAEKFLANTNPTADLEQIEIAKENICKIAPVRLVLISTVDVYKVPNRVDEDSFIQTEGLHPYGYHRFLLEEWARETYPETLIVRLPGLYGLNLKKNFIYDYIHRIPFMLKADKFEELEKCCPQLLSYYNLQNNGFWQCRTLAREDKNKLKELFLNLRFSALNFTDSRSKFQMYPLKRLWDDIVIALNHNLLIFNPATEPMTAGEIYSYLCLDVFVNELSGVPMNYDYQTKYDDLYHGGAGYIMTKEEVLFDLKNYVESQLDE